ncbi:2-oxo acid dehydrogenase subunit E2 [Promethearchaeum syntrophicum]|uniref:2-oxo acid dehydrogenase subunit E2 n=1 Tax=Promethearchaeum syntrophicum TaxID=2594042 RepID=A0A5B9D8R4_9ARCH|nr:2-oxo acid dehydrogenase subunit E2 [Candidatus Prometheoarchaeum syntrophicum]QEE15658.1 branched-chain alpha-keto acid dehydrogenase subunit E2 [Candidatus Prometheoarchaeum syntrophicum]
MKEKDSVTIKKISPMAKAIDDYRSVAKQMHTIWAFGAADITECRKRLRKHKETSGESISFTAFLIACYARVVEKHKYPINTLRYKKKEYFIFDEVDVMTNIERNVDGVKKPVNYTVRNAHIKTLREIHNEIRAAQTKKIELTTGNKGGKKLIKYFPKFPRFIRKIIIHKIFSTPLLKKKLLGTVGLTAAGMMAKTANQLGWMIHLTPHTFSLGIGAISRGYELDKEGKIVERERLAATIAFDHSVIDGAPASRFLEDMYFMIHSGCLEEEWCFKSL